MNIVPRLLSCRIRPQPSDVDRVAIVSSYRFATTGSSKPHILHPTAATHEEVDVQLSGKSHSAFSALLLLATSQLYLGTILGSMDPYLV